MLREVKLINSGDNTCAHWKERKEKGKEEKRKGKRKERKGKGKEEISSEEIHLKGCALFWE